MSGSARAQFLPLLQARTPEEFDAYLDVIEAPEDRRAEQARGFLSAYPESDLRLRVHELLAESCRKRGDLRCALDAADAGLKLAPEYLPLLTLRASVDANTSAAPDPAAAEQALALLDRVKAPKSVDAETWIRETARLRAENLASLGIAAYKRGDTAGAIRRLRESLDVSPLPANQYRLAMLHAASGAKDEARRLLEPLARGGDPDLRARAAAALRSLGSQ